MKRGYILAGFLVLLLLCGCGSQPVELSEPSSYDVCRTMEEYQLAFAAEPSIEDGLLTFFLTNQGEEELIYGYDYHLEQQVDGTWWTVKKLSTTTDGAYIESPAIAEGLPPGSTQRFHVNLTNYGVETLKPGTYRVLIPITVVQSGVEETQRLEIPICL